MSQIILACHGGATSEGAVRVARALRERTGCGIKVVAVLSPPALTDYGYGPVFIPDAAAESLLEDRLLDDVRRQLARCGLGSTDPVVIVGTPASVIAAEAVACGAALIIVGLGPHQIADRALGGETALQLAQMASTPVLAVPASATALPRHIVAAVDYSITSIGAARLAVSWLGDGDSVDLVHVSENSDVRPGARLADPTTRLAEVADSLDRPAGVQARVRLLEEDPARALLDYVQRSHADLVALGSHGYGIWKRLLVGSVASKVLRLAPCAVLVAPARSAMATRDRAVVVAAGEGSEIT